MKRKIFAIILLAVTIGFYSCQKEEENNPIDNNATKVAKKMTPENEAIYNSIVDFREKLLKKDYKAGESISTEDAILLMEASLNLTYGVRENIESIVGESTVLNLNLGRENTEYSTIYITYEEILSKIRQIFKDFNGENKQFASVDLEYDESKNELNVDFSISFQEETVNVGSFFSEICQIRILINSELYRPNYYFYYAINGYVTQPYVDYDYVYDMYLETNYFLNHLLVRAYDYCTYIPDTISSTVTFSPYIFPLEDDYAETIGKSKFYELINWTNPLFPGKQFMLSPQTTMVRGHCDINNDDYYYNDKYVLSQRPSLKYARVIPIPQSAPQPIPISNGYLTD